MQEFIYFFQVPPFFGSPVLIRTGLVSRFTSIAVDPQVGTTEGKTYDVLFVGTTRGRVIKAINAQSADSRDGVDTVIIEELQVSYLKSWSKRLDTLKNWPLVKDPYFLYYPHETY